MSADIKLYKGQTSKIIQSGGFVGLLLSKLEVLLMKTAVPLAKRKQKKNKIKMAPLGITAAASANDA